MSSDLLRWAEQIRPAWDRSHTGGPVYADRKIWEWVYIIQALAERDMLSPGTKGLGFGVGTDPLAAFFACHGCQIVATDLGRSDSGAEHWAGSGQHASGSLAALNADGLCEVNQFDALVRYRDVDMRRIPADLRGFDFTWSACALEHLGSLMTGEAFLLRQMACLKPGGIAVHTTEFNVSSNSKTIGTGPTVLYRRRDIEAVASRLRELGHQIEIDFSTGTAPADLHVDHPPWGAPHLKIQLEEFVVTSMAMVIRKGSEPNQRDWLPSWPWRLRDRSQRLRFAATSRLDSLHLRLAGTALSRRSRV
jgi:hypothetical protein